MNPIQLSLVLLVGLFATEAAADVAPPPPSCDASTLGSSCTFIVEWTKPVDAAQNKVTGVCVKDKEDKYYCKVADTCYLAAPAVSGKGNTAQPCPATVAASDSSPSGGCSLGRHPAGPAPLGMIAALLFGCFAIARRRFPLAS